MSALPPNDLATLIVQVITHAPEWLRRDLSASGQRTRDQAEETLAAMIASALKCSTAHGHDFG